MPLLPIEALVAVLSTCAPGEGGRAPLDTGPAEIAERPEARRIELHWSAPSECADRAHVLGRLDVLLAGRAAWIEGEGTIERDEQGYVLRMHTRSRDGDGVRTLRSGDCEMLGEAAALVLALTADAPGLLRRVAEPQPEPDPEPELEPEPEPEPEPKAQSDPEPEPEPAAEPEPDASRVAGRAPPRLGLRFAGMGGGGLLPGFSPGVAVSLAVFGRHWRVEAGWLHAFARRTQTEDGAEIPGDVQLSIGMARAGWVYRFRQFEVPLMAGVDMGSLRAITALHGGMQRRFWLAFTAGPSLVWAPHHNVALWAGIDAVLPYLRSAFVIENAGTLYAVPPVAVRGLLGLEVRLP